MPLCTRALVAPATALLLLPFVACGASDADSTHGESSAPDSGAPRVDSGPIDSAPIDSAPPPPERELETSYTAPVATGRYVWITNPTSGRVAYIDAATLAVQVVEAGNSPTYLAAVPSGPSDDVALVLNTQSHDATLLRKTPLGLTARRFETHAGANAWKVSADGRWAIAWTDSTHAPAAQRNDKTRGFQDLTVVDLTEAQPPKVVAVGYRPVTVGFTNDHGRAWAVTRDGITIVDLGGPTPIVTKNIAIADNPLEDPGSRDVSVTPDGTTALIRRDGDHRVGVVSLVDGARVSVELAGPVTDLDLSEDGARAIAVVREHAQVSILPIPAIAADPSAFTTVTVTGETVGSVSIAKGGSSAVLYTNAIAAERFTVLALDGDTPRFQVQRLYAPVLAVFPTDDGQNAIVLHDKLLGSGLRAGAFSVVPIAAGLPAKIVGTDAPLGSVALAPANDRAVITERDDARKIYGAFIAKMPSLAVDRYPLASPPVAAGIVALAKRAYVAQEHPDGRITFIDLEGGRARTLTGFELSARIVDGSKP